MGDSITIRYTGTFQPALDSKKRVTVPHKWRGEPGEDLYCFPHPAMKCLVVMPVETFSRMLNEIRQRGDLTQGQKRDRREKITRSSEMVCVDKAGRISLKPDQLEAVGIKDEVILTGDEDRFKIWSPAAFREESQRQDSEIPVSEFATLIDL